MKKINLALWMLLACVAGCGQKSGPPMPASRPFPTPMNVKASAPAGSMDSQGYVSTPLDYLGDFVYKPKPSDASPRDPDSLLPAWVRALDGKKVELEGYLIRLEIREARHTRFLLVKSVAYSSRNLSPRGNEIVMVQVAPGNSVHSSVTERDLLRVRGTLSVGAKNGPESSVLYHLDADQVVLARDRGAIPPGYLGVSMKKLGGFKFHPVYEYYGGDFGGLKSDCPVWSSKIPGPILALNKHRVFVEGFMIPAEVNGDKVREFVLVKSRMTCCYGAIPKANEWVMVRLKPGQEVPYTKDVPLKVKGLLEVAQIQEAGQVVGLYRLQADQVQVREP